MESLAPRLDVSPCADWEAGGFGVYIHWPFCQHKCPYCDFNSHVVRGVDQEAWAAALAAELGHLRGMTGPRAVGTVFFGGGTPSLMRAETVARLLETVDLLWGLARGAEITLEANPTSAEAAAFRGYRAAGVNRLSLGVQALDDTDLRALGRMHSVAEALAAFDTARAVFDRVSFDLIYARMGQSAAAWEAELGRALDLAVDHLSLYQLTIEDGTRFHDLWAAGKLRLPADAAAAEMYALTAAMTASAGLPAYEVSNHARPGAESRHNLVYWRYGDYAGAGPGAHGRLTTSDGRIATETARAPGAWMAAVARDGHALTARETLSGPEQGTEYLLMAMRLSEGADIDRYARLSGRAVPETALAALLADGLVSRQGSRIAATSAGRLVLNRVIGALLD
ncbi:MAG: radical SAM family heme chaperone HemW [Paracoccaceae bacterium]